MDARQELPRLRKAIEALSHTIKEDRQEMVADILSRVVHDQLHKFQQRIAVGIQDSTSDIFEDFKLKIADQIFAAQDNWISGRSNPTLFPVNCRFFTTRGETTVVVIEQSPGLRTLTFDTALRDNESKPDQNFWVYHMYALSVPYVIFLIAFCRGKMTAVYTGWRTDSLRTLDDSLGTPVFPNLHRSLQVCTGDVDRYSDDIATACSQAITDYWASKFNTDLPFLWWDKEKIHPSLETFEIWEAASRENPLFVLDMKLDERYTVREIIQSIIQNDLSPDAEILKHRLYQKIDDCSQAIFSGMMRYFKRIKPERYYPKEVTGQISDAISSVADEVMHLVGRLNEELGRIENETKRDAKDRQDQKAERRGVFWSQSKD